MTEEEILELRINDMVEVSSDVASAIGPGPVVKVVSIDNWRKVIGITNKVNLYFELPYPKIIKKVNQ